MISISAALQTATQQLSNDSPSPARDADILLGAVLHQPLAFLRTYPEIILSEAQLEEFYALVARREEGEPIAYLIGEREFWSLSLQVTRDTLIPRPETELLVERVLTLFDVARATSVLDLGTGSGAIAIAIASERPRWKVSASDASMAALRVAEKNARRNKVEIEFVLGSWLQPFAGRQFDIIVSNPPYVADGDPHLKQGDVRYEPQTALTSGRDGLNDVREIITQAPQYLQHGGWLLLEHGYDQAEAVRALMALDFIQVQTINDLADVPRVTMGQMR